MCNKQGFKLTIISFGHAFGKPPSRQGIDLMFSAKKMNDVNKKLRDKKNGTNKDVQKEIMADRSNRKFYEKLLIEVTTKLDETIRDKKNNELKMHTEDLIRSNPDLESEPGFRVYIGCEKGRHRSVAVACSLLNDIKEKYPKLLIEINHRDLS